MRLKSQSNTAAISPLCSELALLLGGLLLAGSAS